METKKAKWAKERKKARTFAFFVLFEERSRPR